jgi:hypothetical protein
MTIYSALILSKRIELMNRKKKLLLLRARIMIRQRDYVTTQCLNSPELSPWQKLYDDGSDSNFIALVSIDRVAFADLLQVFAKHYRTRWSPGRKGRPPRLIHKHQVLGLILHFYTDASAQGKALTLVFGVPPSTLSRTLRKAEAALALALLEMPDCQFRWPTLEQQKEWGECVEAKYPIIKGRWGFIDGKNYGWGFIDGPKASSYSSG